MVLRRFLILIVLFCVLPVYYVNAQQTVKAKKANIDSLLIFEKVPLLHKGKTLQSVVQTPDIIMDKESSLNYLQHIYSTSSMWRKHNEPLRDAMGVLLYHTIRKPFDSTAIYLSDYNFDSIKVPWNKFYTVDSIKISIPPLEPDTTLTDTVVSPGQPKELYISVGSKIRRVKLSPAMDPFTRNDTISINDSVYVLMHDFIPAAIPRTGSDTTILVISDSITWASKPGDKYPFRRMRYPFMTDSIEVAVRTLLDALEARDSSEINFVGKGAGVTGVWLNSNSDNLRRFWLHDMNGDSVTVWIGSPSRNTFSLQTEEGVFFKRKEWHDVYTGTKLNTVSANNEALRKVTLNKLNPNIWKYRGDISFLFSQSGYSNWNAGGTNNWTTTLDLNGYLYYSNKVTQISWTTTGRLAIGLIHTEGIDLKKNVDIIDINSKLNHKAFGKFDFSGQFQFKSQSFPTWKNDTILVSKFFNPATIILGYGLDYKPTKTLSINVSPLSYKGIFVPDAGDPKKNEINETLYGVEEGKRSKNEMGIYINITSTEKIFKKVKMTNKVQLFSSFLDNPQNIDIDWETTITAPLSWFADIKFNTFIVYDDNSLGAVQFKELFGLTLLFRF